MDTDIFGFSDSLQDRHILDHSTDVIRLDTDIFAINTDINNTLTSPRVADIVYENAPNNSMLYTYREYMMLDPMFPALDHTQHTTQQHFSGNGLEFHSN